MGIALVMPLANVAAAEAAEEEVPFVVFVDVTGGGGLASIISFTFRIQVDAMEALAAM